MVKGSGFLDTQRARQLLTRAEDALKNAYAPYSKFKVGCALLTEDGRIYTGCNIENASYGATNCAERTAIFKAVSEGHKDFTALAIVSDIPHVVPCGICRQVIAEFCSDLEIITGKSDGDIKSFNIKELLPYAFTGQYISGMDE
jgi:cytidine deaminase